MADLTLGRGNRSMPLYFGRVLAGSISDYDLVGFSGVVSSWHFSGLHCRDILVWVGAGCDVTPPRGIPFGREHRQAAERAAPDIEGHSKAAEHSQPGRRIIAFLLAVNIAKLPSVPRQILKDIPRPPNSASRDD
jgi:hypothetical protein